MAKPELYHNKEYKEFHNNREVFMSSDRENNSSIKNSNDIRKKAFETISKPVYKDPETGDYLTALQKYELEHKADLLKYTGLIFAMTNGFKDFDSFAKGKVKKEMKKGLRDLEKTLNNTSRSKDGNLRMITNQREDPDSFISKGMKLDL